MIINFKIQNFGSVNDIQELSFEATRSTDLEKYYIPEPIKGLRLIKFALIYGVNASGKTTILRALDFLGFLILRPLAKKTEPLSFEPFLFDPVSPKLNSLLAIEFVCNKVRYIYEIEFNKMAVVKEELTYYNHKATFFSRKTDLKSQFVEITFGNKVRMDRENRKILETSTLWNNTVLGAFLKTNIYFPELQEIVDWFRTYLNPVIEHNASLNEYVTAGIENNVIDKKSIIGILKKADLNITDIILKEQERTIPDGLLDFLEKEARPLLDKLPEVRNERKIRARTIEVEHKVNNESYHLPFVLESEGTKRYFGLAGLLSILMNRSTIFPIDELESSLHPDLFIHFILTFLVNSKQSQILATTHNREILNNKDIFRNDAIWFTNKNESDATTLYSLADFDTTVIRDTSNVYNAYKIGKLGGVPVLGDYYIE